MDLGRYLWVQATYNDGQSSDEDANEVEMAIGVAEMTVQALELGLVDGSPDFQRDLEQISFGENSKGSGDTIGTVAVAQGGTAAGDTLTYSLRPITVPDVAGAVDTALPGAATLYESDDDLFRIDRANGRLSLVKSLDFETRTEGKYAVVVTATDPSGGADDIVVVVTATDENDNPKLTGRVELTINENADVNAFEGNTGEILAAIEAVIDDLPTLTQAERDLEATAVNRYTFSDPDAQDGFKQWNLSGPDAASFRLVQTVGRLLEFREKPNYEEPADADGDNVYKVTMWTIDDDDARFELEICVTVRNVNEVGAVTLYDSNDMELVQPYESQTVRAEVTDPDGGFRLRHEVVEVVNSWAWHTHVNPPAAQDEAAWGAEPISSGSSYTPDADDIGDFLRATALYEDNAPDQVTDPPLENTNGVYTQRAVTKHAVLQVNLNRAPEFPSASVTRYIAENSPSTTYVDVHIPAAVDPDDAAGSSNVTYEMTDDNDGLFQLVMVNTDGMPVAAGTEGATPVLQIMVAPLADPGNFGTEFDHEDDDLNSYTVEVTASDIDKT